jgi:hypothetical protein
MRGLDIGGLRCNTYKIELHVAGNGLLALRLPSFARDEFGKYAIVSCR